MERYTSAPPHAFHGVHKDNSLIPYTMRPTRKDIFPVQPSTGVTETKGNTPIKYANIVTMASIYYLVTDFRTCSFKVKLQRKTLLHYFHIGGLLAEDSMEASDVSSLQP